MATTELIHAIGFFLDDMDNEDELEEAIVAAEIAIACEPNRDLSGAMQAEPTAGS